MLIVVILLQDEEQKMSTKTKTLVTGAAGFIGSHLSKRLEDEGHNLILIDDYSRGKDSYLEDLSVKTKCLYADLRNQYEVVLFKDVDTVYHCACRIGGNQFLHGSNENELMALHDNLAIDNTVFKGCMKYNIKKIIYTSSISVYNTSAQNSPNAMFSEQDLEKQPLEPEGGYGWAKYIGEMQLKLMSSKYGIARIFKSYGPCDDYSEESGQVVCSLMRKAINYPKEPFVVWGDGSVSRCLVYIDDLIDALLKIDKHLNKNNLIINIGGKRPIPIKELTESIVSISGKEIKINYDKSKPEGVRSRIPVLTKAKIELNWEPTTSLEEGLRKTYRWMKKECQK